MSGKSDTPRHLVPGGTARALFSGLSPDREPPRLADAVRAWQSAIEVDPSAAFVALDVTRLCRISGAAPTPVEERAIAALVLELFAALERGSTAVPIATDEQRRALAERCERAGVDAAAIAVLDGWLGHLTGAPPKARPAPSRQLSLEIARGAGAPPEVTPLLHGPRPLVEVRRGQLVLARWAFSESRIEALLSERRAALGEAERVLAILASLPKIVGRAIDLDGDQLKAVRAGLTGTTTVITGGPGTGKTSIVVAMLRVLVRLFASADEAPAKIALAAPTGKAADRLREAIASPLQHATDLRDRALVGIAPMTLHRLLGYQPDLDRFRFHGRSRLPARFVVVDEASMIDTSLMASLLEALEPDACLILLGDPDQLPSVGPGAVLRDLTAIGRARPELVSWAHLPKSHRMREGDPGGAHVLGVAQKIAAGEAPALADVALTAGALTRASTVSAESLGASMVRATSAPELSRFLDAWMATLPPPPEAVLRGGASEATLVAAAAAAHAARLLVVTRSAAQRTGQDAVNAYLGARHAARIGRSPTKTLLPGEPAVVVANDYVREIFNGDTGLVVEDETGLRLVLESGGTIRSFLLSDVAHQVERAWALTVHRAQGSEHDRVALLLPEEDVPRLFTRQIVYTAITRARRSVTLVGDEALLAAAVARRGERTTGLGPIGGS